jgi:3-methyl-2-oxobutanoate hydroxymethyltransferase
MPYMSYQASTESAVLNAGRFMAEASCDAIKLEGGHEMADRMRAIVNAGIPAVGHLGLTPQSVASLGGFRVQGQGAVQAKEIIDDAKALEEAGAFCILLEMVPDRVTKIITERAEDCLIMSLGSGPDAHGQLLIFHDMFGLYPKFTPKMAKVYGNAGEVLQKGLIQYNKEDCYALIAIKNLIYSIVHILSWALIRYRLPVDAVGLVFAAQGIVGSYQMFFQKDKVDK